MPYAAVTTNVDLPAELGQQLASAVSEAVSEATGKSEAFVMASAHHAEMVMSTSSSPCCFIDFRSIGCVDPIKNAKTSKALSEAVKRVIGVPAERVYINFTDMDRQYWGFRGATF